MQLNLLQEEVALGRLDICILHDELAWKMHFSQLCSSYVGYMLLAGRVRKPEECDIIQEVIQKHLRRKVDPNLLFTSSKKTSPTTAPLLDSITTSSSTAFRHVVWTYGMRRMAVLVGQALKFGEPVLLVGDTGYVNSIFLPQIIIGFIYRASSVCM